MLALPKQESWYEKLHRYDDALEAYDRKYMASASSPRSKVHVDASLGRLRCDAAQLCYLRLCVFRGEGRCTSASLLRLIHVYACIMPAITMLYRREWEWSSR